MLSSTPESPLFRGIDAGGSSTKIRILSHSYFYKYQQSGIAHH
jgi:N-acetylglucosamine kinase-like BadF-type ATPase